MLIIASDPSVHTKRKSVVVKKSYPSGRVCREMGIFFIWRTNGITTTRYRIGLIAKDGGYEQATLNKKVEPASDSDIYYYQNEVCPNSKRNDKLMKACNTAYNRFFEVGYLSKRHGLRGYVKSIDNSTAKLYLNTDVGSRVILALLHAWYPQYEWSLS